MFTSVIYLPLASYDVFNRLVRRQFDPDGSGSQPTTNIFYGGYDGITPTLEFDGTTKDDISHRYLWGAKADQLFADEQVSVPTSNGNVLWPLADHLGTIRDIADFNEASPAFTITNHRVYDTFGRLESETNSAVDLSFGYTGKQFDEASSLNNYLNRWYDPRLGKWLSEDPLGFSAGDANLSRYVGNTATMLTDPLGLAAFDESGAAITTSPNGQWQEPSSHDEETDDRSKLNRIQKLFENRNEAIYDEAAHILKEKLGKAGVIIDLAEASAAIGESVAAEINKSLVGYSILEKSGVKLTADELFAIERNLNTKGITLFKEVADGDATYKLPRGASPIDIAIYDVTGNDQLDMKYNRKATGIDASGRPVTRAILGEVIPAGLRGVWKGIKQQVIDRAMGLLSKKIKAAWLADDEKSNEIIDDVKKYIVERFEEKITKILNE